MGWTIWPELAINFGVTFFTLLDQTHILRDKSSIFEADNVHRRQKLHRPGLLLSAAGAGIIGWNLWLMSGWAQYIVCSTQYRAQYSTVHGLVCICIWSQPQPPARTCLSKRAARPVSWLPRSDARSTAALRAPLVLSSVEAVRGVTALRDPGVGDHPVTSEV